MTVRSVYDDIQAQIVAENVTEDVYFREYEGHYEWIAGKVIKMPPVTDEHSELQLYLVNLLQFYFHFRPIGVLRYDPFVMRMSELKQNRQPDIQMILGDNQENLTSTYMDGAADICVEIVSPGSVVTDRGIKFKEYQQVGVSEYWLIDPQRKEAHFYHLNDDGLYVPQALQNDMYQTERLPGLQLHIPAFWKDPLPDPMERVDTIRKMLDE
jgi:Uma2 family endonuclease